MPDAKGIQFAAKPGPEDSPSEGEHAPKELPGNDGATESAKPAIGIVTRHEQQLVSGLKAGGAITPGSEGRAAQVGGQG
jgi:hypothetical protein